MAVALTLGGGRLLADALAQLVAQPELHADEGLPTLLRQLAPRLGPRQHVTHAALGQPQHLRTTHLSPPKHQVATTLMAPQYIPVPLPQLQVLGPWWVAPGYPVGWEDGPRRALCGRQGIPGGKCH